MDLKIGNPIHSSNSSGATGRPDGILGPETTQGTLRPASTVPNGGDQIEISSLTERIAEGLNATSVRHAEKVAHLTALYNSGRFSPSPADTSRALIAHAIDKHQVDSL